MLRDNPHFLSVPGDPKLGLTVNLSKALSGTDIYGLPPYAPVSGYFTDDYPAAPESWPRSSGSTASYFVGVKEGHGMWLDFNFCRHHSHHVAVVVSIQGINPLTGRKTSNLTLEKYPDDPSIEEWLRGYQNYLATTSTPNGRLWIDGFRAQDGTVRQYVFTKDESKGVAAQLIGVDRVFAIGATFYVSKTPKPPSQQHFLRSAGLIGASGPSGPSGEALYSAKVKGVSYTEWLAHTTTTNCSLIDAVSESKYSLAPEPDMSALMNSTGRIKRRSGIGGLSCDVEHRLASHEKVIQSAVEHAMFMAPVEIQPEEKLEIAAGAQIQQTLYRDHEPLDFWQTEAAGVVIVNYAPQSVVDRILQAGAKPKEGFLGALKVGH
jgi:hypothetical protein